MNGLAEILESGRAPCFKQNAQDPTSADVAVPRALKEIEQTKGAREIVREMGWKPTTRNLNAVKSVWKI